MYVKNLLLQIHRLSFKLSMYCLVFSIGFSQLYADEINELLSEGSACNNFFLYEDAIEHLSKAIEINPSAKEAYRERALSYYELDRLDLALADYYRVTNKTQGFHISQTGYSIGGNQPSSKNQIAALEFAKGLLEGALLGGKEETIEFVSSIRGGLSFLWAFACSPIDVSKELIDAVYAMGEFIAHAEISDLLEICLPELMECKKYWNTWPAYIKGYKMGYIIGKYTITAFFYATMWKGAIVYSNLRRANIMAILERCTLSHRSLILQESVKLAPRNISILKKAFNGSVVAHNPNVAPHVLQKKHRWDKFIRITGNTEEDFKKVTKFLEEIQILQCEKELDFAFSSVSTYLYRKEIGSETVVAIFEVNKNNLPLLKNAWVEVRPPNAF